MKLPRFHPSTVIRDFSGDGQFLLSDAVDGPACFGSTGSGKTSGAGYALALAYLRSSAEMGTLILCSKPDDEDQWRRWAEEAGRSEDIRIFDAHDVAAI
jgi:hypothetical protein